MLNNCLLIIYYRYLDLYFLLHDSTDWQIKYFRHTVDKMIELFPE